MATYSIGFNGKRASGIAADYRLTLNDEQAQAGGQAAAMSSGRSFLCRGPDGLERLYTIDAERSVPGGPVYLLRV